MENFKEISIGIGIIIGAVVSPFVSIILELLKGKENKNVTYKTFLEEKDGIYNDMDIKIEKATEKLATKESVNNLSRGFEKLEKKFDEFAQQLQNIVVNVAVLAERRKEERK